MLNLFSFPQLLFDWYPFLFAHHKYSNSSESIHSTIEPYILPSQSSTIPIYSVYESYLESTSLLCFVSKHFAWGRLEKTVLSLLLLLLRQTSAAFLLLLQLFFLSLPPLNHPQSTACLVPGWIINPLLLCKLLPTARIQVNRMTLDFGGLYPQDVMSHAPIYKRISSTSLLLNNLDESVTLLCLLHSFSGSSFPSIQRGFRPFRSDHFPM